jgi:phage terminase large subunit-like protein
MTTAPIDYVKRADAYAYAVVSKDMPACLQVIQACQRYLDDKERQFDYVLDEQLAARPCRFISNLPLSKGMWASKSEKFKLQDWQVFILVNLFGWVDKETKLRRFRFGQIVVPRKNGKSELAGAIGVYMLCADVPTEYGAEVYCGAQSEQQAWTVFNPARQMVLRTPALKDKFGVVANASNLFVAATNSKFAPIIGKPGDGAGPSLAILDEFHEADTPDLRNAMLTGMGARQQPLLLIITTAGVNLSSPCFDDVLTGRSILAKTITDDRRFYIEYGIDQGDDWTSPEILRKANPNYGVSVFGDFLEGQQQNAVRNAREQSPFRTKHLNQWVTQKHGYFNMAAWVKCHDPNLDEEELRGRDCYIGMDLASKNDMTATVRLYPPLDTTDKWTILYDIYLPEVVVNDPTRDYYRAWFLDGKLHVTDGNITDYDRVMADLDDHVANYSVQEVVFDPSQATYFMTLCMAKNINVVEFKQWAQYYSEPMRQLAALIEGHQVRHNCAEIDPMTWCMGNVVSRPNVKDQDFPSKQKPEKKIDAAVALIMAMARAMSSNTKSVYEDRGFISF